MSRSTDPLAQIDRLSAANRRERSPAIEAKLVRLRHAAFDQLERGEGPREWPPELPDPFPNPTDLPPEINVDALDAVTLGGAITHHGCLLVRGLIPPAAVATLVTDIDRSFDAFDVWAEKGRDAPPSEDFVPFRPKTTTEKNISVLRRFIRANGGVWTVDTPKAMYDLMECFAQIGLRDVISGYLGETPVMSMNKCTLRRVPPDAQPEWHQDGAFLGHDIRSVNVWVALSPCGGAHPRPGLDIVTKRLNELAPTATDGAYFDTSVGHAMVERLAGPGNIRRPEFSPGDALIFDELFLHRTATSPDMTDVRYAAETWFFAPSCYPGHHIPIVL